jgi:hypothetical protein
MSLKKHLAKRYIPSSTKWKLVLKGVGKLYRAVYDELEKDERVLRRKRWLMLPIGLDWILEKP